MKYLVFAAVLFLSGCMSIADTSFYDENESLLIVEVRFEAEKLICGETDPALLVDSIDKLLLYSESKGSVDINKLMTKMKKTSDGITKSLAMCSIKQKIIKKQSKDVANAIMRKW